MKPGDYVILAVTAVLVAFLVWLTLIVLAPNRHAPPSQTPPAAPTAPPAVPHGSWQ